ncbi:prepilin-type N-terminal cleavage/methylation domain-containing protein [Neobacillus notoginsengisoli]|uniref:Prepilin-type N-terminal cleavage/methylation domain-containing protein n=1 Tax=Neobacillus notoginsengisoli TaxID=1578198 RepID=A0A417YTY5_9BACI|nr:prepilin-type N-terminal cleavage/methylation domain-containing protein [Neobacillus notoginsengisoli]RHW40647.1 prepilin-type N-terminal cleavage/methylation domain-containing protein [Neobacillus notoginsengisoli]
MIKYFQKQEGFTLIEVLLSIVLLTIILTSFLGFFTQSAIFTNKNQEKLSAAQTAQKVVSSIELNTTKAQLKAKSIVNDTGKVVSPSTVYNDKSQFNELFKFTIVTPFTVEIKFSDGPMGSGLIQCKVSILDNSSPPKTKSETFTYIR